MSLACKVDLVFLMDGSWSIGKRRFKIQKDFLAEVAQVINIGVTGPMMGVIQYGLVLSCHRNQNIFSRVVGVKRDGLPCLLHCCLLHRDDAVTEISLKSYSNSRDVKTSITKIAQKGGVSNVGECRACTTQKCERESKFLIVWFMSQAHFHMQG